MTIRQFIVPTYVLLCLLLGGASAEGFMANLILQVLATIIIVWALGFPARSAPSIPIRRLLLVAGLFVLLGVVQLIPLPPAIWTLMSGRAQVAEGLHMLQLPLPWLPLSLAPNRTVADLLWTLPGFAVLLGIVRAKAFHPVVLALAILAGTFAGIALGALQVTGGDNTGYFYEVSNFGRAVGFFSNANHMATLMLASLPLIACLLSKLMRERRSRRHTPAVIMIAVGAVAAIIVGLAINQSLAGFGLAVPVVAASAALLWLRKHGLPVWSQVAMGVLTVMAFALVLSAPMGNNLTGQDAQTSDQSRYTTFTHTLEAGLDYFPIGAGSGTFIDIYPSTTDPDTTTRTFVNHAHNDYLELFLETGLGGILVLAAFLAWWGQRAMVIWRTGEADDFARAATIITALILLHSLVDYPLRTAAIDAVFAAACALMAQPGAAQRARSPNASVGRHISA